MRLFASILLFASLCCAGCSALRAHPADDGVPSASTFLSRSLRAPGLARFLRVYLHRDASEPRWGLEKLTLAALYYAPDLDLARARTEAARAAVITAGTGPNPTITLTPQYAVNPGDGYSPWSYGFGLDLPFVTAGKQKLATVRAQRLAEASRLGLANTAWQVRSRVRAALVDALVDAQEVAVLRREVAAEQDLATVFAQRFAVGAISQPRLDETRTALANARVALAQAQGAALAARAALADAVGVPATALDGLSLDWTGLLHPLPTTGMSGGRLQRLGLWNRLDLRRALLEYAASRDALALAIAGRVPNLHLGPGYAWQRGRNTFTLSASFDLPQQRGPIAEAQAGVALAAARAAGVQAHAIGQIATAFANYAGARDALREADSAVALVRSRRAAVERAFQLGALDRLGLADMRVQQTSLEKSRLDALRTAQQRLGALEDAVQVPLGTERPAPPATTTNPRKQPS